MKTYTSLSMDNCTESLDNFERIRKRASNCGYETSYGVIRDNNNKSDVIVIVGLITITIGGYFYLRKKIKNLFKKPELKTCGSNYNEKQYSNFKEKKNNIIAPIFDKSKAVDVDFVVRLNDEEHPEKTRYNCQFSI